MSQSALPESAPQMIIIEDLVQENERIWLGLLKESLYEDPSRIVKSVLKLSALAIDHVDDSQAGFTTVEFAVSKRGSRLFEYDDATEAAVQASDVVKAARKAREASGPNLASKKEQEQMRAVRIARFSAFTSLVAAHAIATTKAAGVHEPLPQPRSQKAIQRSVPAA